RRQDQRNYAGAGDRTRNYNIAFAEDTRMHARAVGRATSRGTTPPPTPLAPLVRSRPPGDPPRIIPSPDLRLAPRGPDGHPQSPWAVRRASPESIDDDDDGPIPDPEFSTIEEARIARFRSKPLNDQRAPPIWNPGNPRLLGRFHHHQIQTLDQAYNIISFLHNGQDEAYELFQVINQNGSGFPEVFRTEGEAYLIRHQQELERMWWNTTTGAPRPPRHVRHPNTRPAVSLGPRRDEPGPSTTQRQRAEAGPPSTAVMQEERQAPRVYGPPPVFAPAPATYIFGNTTPIRTTPSTTAVVRPVPPPPTPGDAQGYLGTSPPNPADSAPTVPSFWEFPSLDATPNSRWSINDLTNRFTRIHPRHWNMAVRDYLGHAPTTLGDTPRRDDVLPSTPPATPIPAIFRIEGLYDHVVRIGEYEVASLPLEHYPFLTDNITIYLVAAWFAQHGIAPGTPEVAAIQEFARIRRNVSLGITNWENSEWVAEPRNMASTLSMTRGEIPHRTDLQHAPLRPAPTGLAASIHAPAMEDVLATTDVATAIAPDAPSDDAPAANTTTGEEIVEGFVQVHTP
ncbi:hypothetical protein B0H11DRAFT_1938389, partial [Mycena galericulata]